MALSPGTDFASYHLIRPLGQGGFAEVWEADSMTTGRRVALKILSQLPASSSNALERFRQEGRLAAGLHHPRCCYVFDAGEVAGVPYISMELMPGGTLADRARAGPLPVAVAVDYVIDMLDGLEAAHAAGIIREPSQSAYDAARSQVLETAGYYVIRIQNRDLTRKRITEAVRPFRSPSPHGGEGVRG